MGVRHLSLPPLFANFLSFSVKFLLSFLAPSSRFHHEDILGWPRPNDLVFSDKGTLGLFFPILVFSFFFGSTLSPNAFPSVTTPHLRCFLTMCSFFLWHFCAHSSTRFFYLIVIFRQHDPPPHSGSWAALPSPLLSPRLNCPPLCK